jgi:hypothetical protein
MVAKIVPVPPPVQITDEDLEIAETGCRANAARCRREGAIEEVANSGNERTDARRHSAYCANSSFLLLFSINRVEHAFPV